jgi:hypothetical protein
MSAAEVTGVYDAGCVAVEFISGAARITNSRQKNLKDKLLPSHMDKAHKLRHRAGFQDLSKLFPTWFFFFSSKSCKKLRGIIVHGESPLCFLFKKNLLIIDADVPFFLFHFLQL